MTVDEVIAAMRGKYAAFTSYEDQGVVLTEWPDKPSPDEIVFSTHFRRPDRFRFDWTRHHPHVPLRHLKTRHVIWSDGKGAFSYSDEDRIVQAEESLAMAVAGATGVSKGSALTVINLLMPLLDAMFITDLRGLELCHASIEGVSCYCIRGRDTDGDRHEFCLGADDFLLRSVSVDHALRAQRTRYVSRAIRRNIRIDHDIDESTFRFSP